MVTKTDPRNVSRHQEGGKENTYKVATRFPIAHCIAYLINYHLSKKHVTKPE